MRNVDMDTSGLTLIAEAGTGHGGNFTWAVEMVKAAAQAGATHIKFQHVDPEYFALDKSLTAYRWFKQCRFQPHLLENLKAVAEGYGLRFLCTPQTVEDFQDLVKLGIEEVKISSDNARNIPLLEDVNRWGQCVYLSCGAISERDAVMTLNHLSRCVVTLMVCTSEYPCPPEHANLSRFCGPLVSPLGFSDHTFGQTAALVAYGLGARVFEKHFRIPGCSGPDMAVAISEQELAEYFGALREAEIMMGDGRWPT